MAQQTEQATTKISEPPFMIKFSNGDKSVSISLINGNDVFKLAEVFKNMLIENEIEYDIQTIENK